MASDNNQETIRTQPQGTNIGESLPFYGLDNRELKFGHVISGPRISLAIYKTTPYGQWITMRNCNYLAGYTKKSLRIRKHVSDLKAFVDLPVELQLIVLEHLHPIDLHHFSRVSRYFRQLVLDPAVLPVWKAIFVRHPDLPRPPPGVKEPEWAFMIFGPGICGVCGKYGALTDFSLRKRFCEPCLNNHTLPQRDFRVESNKPISSQDIIWELIPCTTRTSGRYPRFLKTDFSIMWKKLKLIRILHMNGVRLPSPLLKEYITARKDYIRRLNNSVRISNNWADRIFRQLTKECDELINQLPAKCRTRLQALGYTEWDIEHAFLFIRNLLREKTIYRLTRRVFREIRPSIEVFLRNCQIRRIKNERQRLLLNIYQDYLKTRSPDEWSYLPGVNARSILETESFKKLIGPPFDERVNITPGNVVPLLPEFIEKWIKGRQEKFADMLPKDPDETLEARIQRLELVTSVMTCKTHSDTSPLIGWKGICHHQVYFNERCRRYVMSHHAVAAATSLVSSLGLDPLTTTVDDMNRRSDRFMCGNCSPEVRHGRLSRRAYTWLECLEHATHHFSYGDDINANAKPVWLPLSLVVAQFVRAQEKPFPGPLLSVWRCNHCAHHFEKQTLRADAIDHVKKVHLIRVPAIGMDVVADTRKPIDRRREAFRLSLDPAYDHTCKHCSDAPIFKLWQKDILMKHLIKRHHIPEPAEHVDWEKVPMIALSAALVLT